MEYTYVLQQPAECRTIVGNFRPQVERFPVSCFTADESHRETGGLGGTAVTPSSSLITPMQAHQLSRFDMMALPMPAAVAKEDEVLLLPDKLIPPTHRRGRVGSAVAPRRESESAWQQRWLFLSRGCCTRHSAGINVHPAVRPRDKINTRRSAKAQKHHTHFISTMMSALTRGNSKDRQSLTWNPGSMTLPSPVQNWSIVSSPISIPME